MADIVVTGAGGFIGRALCRNLRRSGREITELSSRNGDIADPTTLTPIRTANHVFHLAGRTFVPDSWRDPVGFHKVNVLGTANVLEFCRSRGARLTYVSAYLYGVPDRLPVLETFIPRPNNPYALSKYLAEQLCEFEALYHGVEVTVIRPFNIYGPGQSADFLIPRIVRQVRERQPIRVKDLAPRRDYLYIDEFVDALAHTLTLPCGYNVINIGSGTSLSVGELIAIIQMVMGTKLPVISEDEHRPNEIADVRADTSKARKLLGWVPSLTFLEGIERMMLEDADT